MDYLMNCWYMAGWSDDVTGSQLVARTFLNQPVVMFRRSDGTPAALLDRCPHRVVPLSRGIHLGNAVQCAYHGLRFDGSGACIQNPHGAIPPAARVKSFPMADAHGILWIWMGDEPPAEEAIPDLSHIHALPALAQSKGTMPSACSYLLIIDNVADLSHVEYLHASTLGGGAFIGSRPQVAGSEDDTVVTITQLSEAVAAPPVYDRFLATPGVKVDLMNRVTWMAPGVLKLDISVVPVGDAPESGLHTFNAHIVTPCTATTSHYWYWLGRDYRPEDADLTRLRQALMTDVFHVEDKPILEAQQALLGTTDLYAAHPVLMGTDGGPTRIRRSLGRLMSAASANRVSSAQ